MTGFDNKQYCLYESFPAWYKQCEWHAKFIAGAICQVSCKVNVKPFGSGFTWVRKY